MKHFITLLFFQISTTNMTSLIYDTPNAADKVLDAAEAAEKQTLSATSKAASRAVSNR